MRDEGESPCATPGPEPVLQLADRRTPVNTTRADHHQRGTRLRVLAVVSDAESAGDRDRPDRGRVKIIRAADAFDRRDHVMSVVAYELHVRATLGSAALDHPGLVPDEYLASLTGEDLHSLTGEDLHSLTGEDLHSPGAI